MLILYFNKIKDFYYFYLINKGNFEKVSQDPRMSSDFIKNNYNKLNMDNISKYYVLSYDDIVNIKYLNYTYISRYQELDIDRLIRNKEFKILDKLDFKYICKYQRLKVKTIYKLIFLGYKSKLSFTSLFQYQYLNKDFRKEFKHLILKDKRFIFETDTIIHNIGFKNYIIFKIHGRDDYNFMGTFTNIDNIKEYILNIDSKYNKWKKMWLIKINKKIN